MFKNRPIWSHCLGHLPELEVDAAEFALAVSVAVSPGAAIAAFVLPGFRAQANANLRRDLQEEETLVRCM